jgi:hypothetical protein
MRQSNEQLGLHIRHQAFQILAQLPEDPGQALRILDCARQLLTGEKAPDKAPIELKMVR